jgi:hypothetical protein
MTLPPGAANQLEVVSIRQEVLEDVVSSSLQVDASIAQIDNEIAQAGELHGYLADKRDRRSLPRGTSTFRLGTRRLLPCPRDGSR